MMSSNIGQIRGQIQDALAEAEKRKNSRNYRSAFAALQNAKKLLEDHPHVLQEFEDESEQIKTAEKTLRREARNNITEIQQQLDGLLRVSVEAYDIEAEEEAAELIEQWQDNILGNIDSDTELKNYNISVLEQRENAKRYREARSTDQQVRQLLQDAKDKPKISPDITSDELLRLYYRPARDLARDAASRNQENPYLEELKTHAEKAYERASKVLGLVTTAAQDGRFRELLDYYNSLPAGEMVPYYLEGENFQGNISVQEALEKTKKAAEAYAVKKTGEYREQARAYLDQLRPIEALAILEQIKANNLDDFLKPDTLNKVNDLERDIRTDKQLLDDALIVVEEAREIAETEKVGLQAWNHFSSASKTYGGVTLTDTADSVKYIIVQRLRQELKEHLENIQQLIDENNLRRAIQEANTVLNDYNDIDAKLAATLGDIENLGTQADNQRKFNEDVEQTLNRIKTLLAEQNAAATQDAEREINALRTRHDPHLLEILDEYNTQQAAINRRINIDAEHKRLEAFTRNPDEASVERAMNMAQNAAQEAGGDPRFEALARQLDLHLEYLRAQRDKARGRLDDAEKRLQKIIEAGENAPDFQDAEDLADEVSKALRSNENTTRFIKDIEQLIADQNYEDAFTRLDDPMSMKAPRRQDRTTLEDFKVEAQHGWRKQIISYFGQLSIEQENLNATKINNDLQVLELTLNAQNDANAWRQRLQPVLNAAYANIATNADEALQQWEYVLEGVYSPQERNFVRNKILILKKTQIREKLNKQIREVDEASRDDISRALGQLGTLAGELDELAREWQDPLFNILYLRAQLTRAMLTEDADRRDRLFARAYEISRRPELNQDASDLSAADIEDRDLQVRLAKSGRELAGYMTEIEQNLSHDKSIDELQKAVQIWDKNLSTYIEDFPVLENWYTRLKRDVETPLLNEIGADTGSFELSHLQPLAKLLIIGHARGERLKTELPNLHASLEREIDNTIKGYKQNTGFEDIDDPLEMIEEQLKQLKGLQRNLDIVSKMISQFRGAAELREIAQNFERGTTSKSRDIEKADENLVAIRTFYTAIENSLIRGQAGEEDARASLDKMVSLMPDHRATHVAKAKVSALTDDLKTIKEKLESLRDAMKKEQFQEASQLLNSISADKLQTYNLNGNLRIRDVYKNRDINDWNDVLDIVAQRLRAFDEIQDWAAPFEPDIKDEIFRCGTVDPRSNANAQTNQGQDEEKTNKWVVDWESHYQQSLAYIEQGQFKKATEIVLEAIHGSGNIISLTEAIERAENPPIVEEIEGNYYSSGNSDVRTRFRDAKRYAGTNCGKRILESVEQECRIWYREDLRKAEEHLETIETQKAYVAESERVYKAGLRRIGNALNGDKKIRDVEINQGLSQTQSAIKAIQTVLNAQHPLVLQMKNHYLLQQIQRER